SRIFYIGFINSRRVFMASNLYFLASTKLIASSEWRPLPWPSENLGWRKNHEEAHHHGRGCAGIRRGARFCSRIRADALRQSFERRRIGRRLQFERDAGKAALSF